MENGTSVQERVFGERFRTTLVCVDKGRTEELSGRLIDPCLGEGTPFSGTLDLLGQIAPPGVHDVSWGHGHFIPRGRGSAGAQAPGRVGGYLRRAGVLSPERPLAGVRDLDRREAGRELVLTGTWTYESITPATVEVSYQWDGDVPSGAALPGSAEVNKGASYTVDNTYTNGTETTVGKYSYAFSGWKDGDGNVVTSLASVTSAAADHKYDAPPT